MTPSKNVTTADFVLFAKRLRSMNERTNIPFYIFAPDFRDSSVGVRVLHYLCHILNEMGEEAYIVNARKTSPHLRTPKLTYAQLEQHFVAGLNPVSIYPEVIWRNPANTPLVVRWLLNIPGHLGKPIEFEPKDIIYYYEPWCLPSNRCGDQLWIHPVNHAIFNNDENTGDSQRTLECYYANKYFLGGSSIREEHKKLVCLGQNIKRSHKEIAEILRKSKVLYLYEPSGMLHEALACGCPVVLVRSDYWPLPPEDSHHKTPGCVVIDEKNALEKATAALKLVPNFHINARDNSWNMTRQMVEAVYRAEEALKQTGKPLLNSLQQLWALGSDDRILHLGKLRRFYEESGIYLADVEAEHAAPELSPAQRYSAYLAASTEKIQEINEAASTHHQAKTQNSPSIPMLELPEALITIVVRAKRQHLDLLANTIDSLAAHGSPSWHLIIVSDFDEPEALDEIDRIHWINTCSSEEAKSFIDQTVETLVTDWVLETPAGTLINERLFQRLLRTAEEDIHAIFCDDDLYDSDLQRHSVRFKPGVNLEALRSTDLAGPLCVRRTAWLQTGGTWVTGEAAWFYKLLTLTRIFGARCLKHLPQVLLSYADTYFSHADACLMAMHQHIQESGSYAHISPIDNVSWTVIPQLPSPPPSVDLFIYTRGDLGLLDRCIGSIRKQTSYPAMNIGFVTDLTETDRDVDHWFATFAADNPASIIVKNQQGETYAVLANRAVAQSSAEFVVFLNDESVAIQRDWLKELVSACSRKEVAGASPRLLKPGTNLLENTGYVLGLNGWRAAAFHGQGNSKTPGQFDWIDCARDITTLTSSSFIIRTSAFRDAGGMDEENFTDQIATADLSLRLFDKGHRLLYVPRANLAGNSELPPPLDSTLETQSAHFLSQKRNLEAFKKRWWPQFATDPFWNPNLSLIENTPAPESEYIADWSLGDDGKPKILAHVIANAQADFRVTSALKALRRQNRIATCIWEQRVFTTPRYHTPSELSRLNPDVHIVQNYIHDNALSAMNQWYQMGHRPFTVYALDDVITDIDPSSPFFKNFSADSYMRLKYALARSDRMVVSTNFLANLYQNLIRDIRVVPNRLDMETWLPLRPQKRTSEKPRIGWAGGTTHQRDLLLLKEVIEQTRAEADWIFFGMCPEEIRPLVAEAHPFVPFEQYPAFLASLNFDIAVAPLATTVFNQGKSNLRLLELGILGLPVICTNIDPYQDSPACRVSNSVEHWVSALRERIHDPDGREAEGAKMRQWVLQNYLLENHLDEWLSAHMPD